VKITDAKIAIGKMNAKKVGRSNNVKLRKIEIDKPRFTIISTNLRDCVSQTIQVSIVATKIVATMSCLNMYQNILFIT
tara:strand:+ start:2821 stop:3054 length:234 start_codon:yes stop_codon:yes gene_type:complete